MKKETKWIYGFILFTWFMVLGDAICIHEWAKETVKKQIEETERLINKQYGKRLEEGLENQNNNHMILWDIVKDHNESIHYGRTKIKTIPKRGR